MGDSVRLTYHLVASKRLSLGASSCLATLGCGIGLLGLVRLLALSL